MRWLLTAAAVFLVAAAGTTAAPAPAGAAPLDPAGGLGFDFGCAASPVADGYRQVANTTVYDSERGYGLTAATDCRDRGDGDLLGDFTNAAGYSFLVDLPDGDYHVIVHSGDAIASNRTTVTVEGVNLGEIFSASGEYGSVNAVVGVQDGQLEVAVGNNGRTNAVEIAPVATPTGLQVTGTTLVPEASVALAWDEVPDASHYLVYRGESAEDLTLLAEAPGPEFLDETVELGLGYTYAVSAQVGVVESNRSDPVTVQLRDESVPAPAPPSQFGLRATTTRSVTLGWAAVDGAVAYYVYRSDSADGPFDRVATVDTNAHTDPVTPSRHLHYRVRAVSLGGLSDPTGVVTSPVTVRPLRSLERLSDRGLVAVPATEPGLLVSWRMLGPTRTTSPSTCTGTGYG